MVTLTKQKLPVSVLNKILSGFDLGKLKEIKPFIEIINKVAIKNL
ncbi:MAG: hypothetical protein Q8N28_00740 [bacterium]|nr:hypothetical protein [bacterium]